MFTDTLSKVEEKNTLRYIYNPNTEQKNRNIMNEYLKKNDKNKNSSAHITTKKSLKIKGFNKGEKGSNKAQHTEICMNRRVEASILLYL